MSKQLSYSNEQLEKIKELYNTPGKDERQAAYKQYASEIGVSWRKLIMKGAGLNGALSKKSSPKRSPGTLISKEAAIKGSVVRFPFKDVVVNISSKELIFIL